MGRFYTGGGLPPIPSRHTGLTGPSAPQPGNSYLLHTLQTPDLVEAIVPACVNHHLQYGKHGMAAESRRDYLETYFQTTVGERAEVP